MTLFTLQRVFNLVDTTLRRLTQIMSSTEDNEHKTLVQLRNKYKHVSVQEINTERTLSTLTQELQPETLRILSMQHVNDKAEQMVAVVERYVNAHHVLAHHAHAPHITRVLLHSVLDHISQTQRAQLDSYNKAYIQVIIENVLLRCSLLSDITDINMSNYAHLNEMLQLLTLLPFSDGRRVFVAHVVTAYERNNTCLQTLYKHNMNLPLHALIMSSRRENIYINHDTMRATKVFIASAAVKCVHDVVRHEFAHIREKKIVDMIDALYGTQRYTYIAYKLSQIRLLQTVHLYFIHNGLDHYINYVLSGKNNNACAIEVMLLYVYDIAYDIVSSIMVMLNASVIIYMLNHNLSAHPTHLHKAFMHIQDCVGDDVHDILVTVIETVMTKRIHNIVRDVLRRHKADIKQDVLDDVIMAMFIDVPKHLVEHVYVRCNEILMHMRYDDQFTQDLYHPYALMCSQYVQQSKSGLDFIEQNEQGKAKLKYSELNIEAVIKFMQVQDIKNALRGIIHRAYNKTQNTCLVHEVQALNTFTIHNFHTQRLHVVIERLINRPHTMLDSVLHISTTVLNAALYVQQYI